MILATLKKELATLWTSPLPYLVAVLFNAATGVLFVDQLAGRRQAVVQPLYPIAGFLLLVLIPVLTMRTFADEERAGTLDLLLAIPARARDLVISKWLGVFVTASIVVAPTLLLPLMVSWWGDPDWGPVLTGYVGLALVAAATSAIGVLTSACTASQAIAAVAATFVGLASWFGAGGWISRFSMSERLHSFAGGAIAFGDAVFFSAIVAASLAAAAGCVRARGR